MVHKSLLCVVLGLASLLAACAGTVGGTGSTGSAPANSRCDRNGDYEQRVACGR